MNPEAKIAELREIIRGPRHYAGSFGFNWHWASRKDAIALLDIAEAALNIAGARVAGSRVVTEVNGERSIYGWEHYVDWNAFEAALAALGDET